MRCKLAVTLGDPAGIGTEIVLKFLASNEGKKYDITLFAHKFLIDKYYHQILKTKCDIDINIIEPEDNSEFDFEYGKYSAICGKASMQYIKQAVELTMQKSFDAIVTLPINKYSIHAGGYDFMGHTEYLAYLTKSSNYSMMLASEKLKTVLVTTHLPIKDIPNSLTEKSILLAIHNAHNAGKFFGKPKPKLGICGLNPHAGDNGALGSEELNIINPAVQKAKDEGINIDFCKPADTIYLDKSYDIIIAIYHDQALIPIKLLSFGKAVNVTLGLPIIRTSVDHGTAFDIVKKSIADTSSFNEAIKFASRMVDYVRPY